MVKVLLIQGANMSLLGIRQPDIYGKTSAADLDRGLLDYAARKGFHLEIEYTNSEGTCVDRIIRAYRENVDVLVMNPGGFTYSGQALRDTIKGVSLPYVEIHLSNHYERNIHSVIASAAQCVIMGLGVQGYYLALDAALFLAGQKKEG
jgi:3-dehydroquinate dehydratase II